LIGDKMNVDKLIELGIEVKDGKIRKKDAKQVRKIHELEDIKEKIKSLSSLDQEEQVKNEIKQALQTTKTEGKEDAWLLADLTNWLSLALHYATFGEEMRLSWDSISLERIGPYHYKVTLNAFMGGDRANEHHGDCVFEFYDEDNKIRTKIGKKVITSPAKFIKEAFDTAKKRHEKVIEKKKKAIEKDLKKDPELEDVKNKIKSLGITKNTVKADMPPGDGFGWDGKTPSPPWGSNSSVEKKKAVKLSKQAKELLAFIKDQTKLDLTPLVHEKQAHPRRYLGVDMRYDRMQPSEDFRALLQLENRYGKGYFEISDNGGLGIALVYGPKLTTAMSPNPTEDKKNESISNVYRCRQESPGPLDNLSWLYWLKNHDYTTEEGEEYLAEDVDNMIKQKEAQEAEASTVRKKISTLASLAVGVSKTTVKQAEKMIPTIEMAKKQIEYVSTILPEIDSVLRDSNLHYEIPALRKDFSSSFDNSGLLQGLDEVLQSLKDYVGK